jgi:hypothetical protein
MTDDKPNAERETAEGHEVFVTKDESGITSLAEEEEAADPRVSTDADGDSDDDDEKGSSGDADDDS